jgi:hypothetical protein
MIDIRCSSEGTKCTDCPIKRDCDFIEITEDVDPYAFYEKGRADRTKEFQKQFDMMYADKLEQVRADEREKVVEECLEILKTTLPRGITYQIVRGKIEQLKSQNSDN